MSKDICDFLILMEMQGIITRYQDYSHVTLLPLPISVLHSDTDPGASPALGTTLLPPLHPDLQPPSSL